MYPENTLLAFERAIEVGSHMLELDVALTRDKQVVIIHDETLERTTNGKGLVSSADFHEIRKLDAGSWFHPALNQIKVPSLEEILALLSKKKEALLNIEIKAEYWSPKKGNTNIENLVLRAVEKYKLTSRVCISSFHWGYLARIRELAPQLKLSLLHSPSELIPSNEKEYKSNLSDLELDSIQKRYKPFSINPEAGELSQNFIHRCHSKNIKVVPYTINSYNDFSIYFSMGVDGMFTNHPDRLLDFTQEKSSFHS